MSRLRRPVLAWLLVVAVLATTAGVAHAAWREPAAGSLNIDPTRGAYSQSLASVGGVPYVAWSEYDGTANQIRVKRFDGASWTAVGGSLNFDASKAAGSVSLASVGGVPYTAWSETDGTASQIRVKRFDGASWTAVGGSLNVDAMKDAFNPSLADVGGVPYVAWSETDGTATQIRVKRFDGASWTAVSGSLNIDATKDADSPSIASVGGVPYVAWQETNGTYTQLHVALFDGANWGGVGGFSDALNISTKDAFSPSLASVGGVPYVAWSETDGTAYQIRVKRADPYWSRVGGGSLNFDPTRSAYGQSLADVGGVPYVAWSDSTGGATAQLRVKRFDGASWSPVGGSLNFQPVVKGDSLASLGGVPYVAWGEGLYSSSKGQTYVKRLEPDFLQYAALATDTKALLLAKVRDYGAAYPIAFQYGPGGGLGTQTAVQQTAGTGSDTVTQQIAALTSQTAYSWRAIGVDSLGPTAIGATQTFTTERQNGPGPAGPPGPRGAPGRDAVVRCKLLGAARAGKRRRPPHIVCTVKLIAGHPRSTIAARLVRGRTVYASGRSKAGHGRRTLALHARRALSRGRYTLLLTITGPQGTLPVRLFATVS